MRVWGWLLLSLAACSGDDEGADDSGVDDTSDSEADSDPEPTLPAACTVSATHTASYVVAGDEWTVSSDTMDLTALGGGVVSWHAGVAHATHSFTVSPGDTVGISVVFTDPLRLSALLSGTSGVALATGADLDGVLVHAGASVVGGVDGTATVSAAGGAFTFRDGVLLVQASSNFVDPVAGNTVNCFAHTITIPERFTVPFQSEPTAIPAGSTLEVQSVGWQVQYEGDQSSQPAPVTFD